MTTKPTYLQLDPTRKHARRIGIKAAAYNPEFGSTGLFDVARLTDNSFGRFVERLDLEGCKQLTVAMCDTETFDHRPNSSN